MHGPEININYSTTLCLLHIIMQPKDAWFEGKGTQRWKKTGVIYDGDWKDDLRHGYGTMAKPAAASHAYRKLYAGGWKKDKRHVQFIDTDCHTNWHACPCVRAMEQTTTVTKNTMKENGTKIREVGGAGCITKISQFMRANG